MNYPIISMSPDLWPAVREIYREGIATGNATFETEVPEWDKWDSSHLKNCRLVALEPFDEDIGESLITSGKLTVLGWAALSPVSSRRIYRGVAEVSVYVAASARGRGVGKELLGALVQESEVNGIWTLQAGIFRETREYCAAQIFWISEGRCAEADRQTGRRLERRDSDGEAERSCR